MPETPHLADIMCGTCGHLERIALGVASAIACPGCRTEIQIGEPDPSPDIMMTAEMARMESAHRAITRLHVLASEAVLDHRCASTEAVLAEVGRMFLTSAGAIERARVAAEVMG